MYAAIEDGPAWVQYVIAFGTAGAAIFAGWAAYTARSATKATAKLVQVEVGRDLRSAEEARTRQARRVTVDMSFQSGVLPNGQRCYDAFVLVGNDNPDPITKVRLKVVVGDAVWGPQLVGTIRPTKTITLTARLITEAPPDNCTALARFLDVEGRPWVANARSLVESDVKDLDDWLEESRTFQQSNLSPEERGNIVGRLAPDVGA